MKFKKKAKIIILVFGMIFAISIINNRNFSDVRETTASDKKSPLSPLASTWILNGTPVCKENNHQHDFTMCSDDEGGIIIAWTDSRTGISNQSIYAQRINSMGDIVWTAFPDGVPIWTNTSTFEVVPQICSDGEGGAIITWMDNRSGMGDWDIYAQRINSTGGLEWNPQGVPICTDDSIQQYPQIISVVGGEALIAWADLRLGNYDIFAQRIDSDGVRQWWSPGYGWDGRPVCTQTDMQFTFDICSDGAGGAIIAWEDSRTGWNNKSVYAQRVDYNGNQYWITDGETICTITNCFYDVGPKIISDELGGAIIAWNDNRTGGADRYNDIYAQRVNLTGDPQWTDQGVAICTAVLNQDLNDITYDGANGAIIIWEDNRNGPYEDLYIQKVNSMGEIQWTPNGVEICTANGEQRFAEICNDGRGGIFAVWDDERYGEEEDDIYAQHIDSKGISQWIADGVIVCNENNEQDEPEIICNAAGSAIIVWEDKRSGTNKDIYAFHVEVIDKEPQPGPPPGDDNDDDDDEIEFLGSTLIIVGIASAIGIAGVAIYLIWKRRLKLKR